ncbi:hypothetical protein [Butyrivibrio fibrisolvens]|uniref:hypothetical protein n=1 Tax=Butyrivibrio fibrisolvens TaxID=831 RepID=UPI0004095599|nr:hypothetical protein [Butyrivibrio fibrisolvens]
METTFVDGINEPNKDNSGINENVQKGFSEWVNNEVTEIVKQNIYEEDFYQEKIVIEIKVNGDHEGSFSIVIDKENDDYSNRVQVLTDKIDYDICIEGDCTEVFKFLNKKSVLEDEIKKGRLVATSKNEENDKLIEQISYIFAPFKYKRKFDFVSLKKFIKGLFAPNSKVIENKSGGLVKKSFIIIGNLLSSGSLLVLGLFFILLSIVWACIDQNSVYAITKTENNETINVGYIQDVGSDDTIDLANADFRQLEKVGIVSFGDEDSTFDILSANTYENKIGPLAFCFFGYILILAWLLIIGSDNREKKDESGVKRKIISKVIRLFKSVSAQSFCTFVLFLPLAILAIMSMFSRYSIVSWGGSNVNIPVELIFHIYGILQCLCLALWFGFHLWPRWDEKLSEKKCIKLDLYSTIAVVILTFMWVVYDISFIKIYFAIILVEFMMVQVSIKMSQLGRC